jgi:hypothetical protein
LPYKRRRLCLGTSPGLRLGLLLRLCILLLFLLLGLELLVRFALEARLLLGRLLNRFEEALQSALLRRLHVLGQLGGAAAHAVFVEMLLFDEEFDKAFDVRGFPFHVALCRVGGAHVGLEEELARVGVGPVFGDCVLAAALQVLDYVLEVLVLADKLQCGAWADALDGVEVVAAEEDTKVNELVIISWMGLDRECDWLT